MARFVHVLLLAPLLLAACARERPVEVHGTVERDRLELIAESNERIVEVPVHEGDRVDAGAVLVRQEAGTAEPRMQQSRAALAEADAGSPTCSRARARTRSTRRAPRSPAPTARCRRPRASTSACRRWSSAGC